MPRIFYQEEECSNSKSSSVKVEISNLNESKDMSVELLAIRSNIHDALKRNRYSKNIRLAAFYDNQRMETIDAVLKVLAKIDARLKTLENVVQPGRSCNCNCNCKKIY